MQGTNPDYAGQAEKGQGDGEDRRRTSGGAGMEIALKSPRRNGTMKKGLSLTELIVSMVVIAVGLLTLATLLSVSRKSLIGNDIRTRGIEYLQAELELFEEMGYENIVASFHDGVEYDAIEGLPSGYHRRFCIFHNDPIRGIVRVRVVVTWEEEQKTWSVKTETYITRK